MDVYKSGDSIAIDDGSSDVGSGRVEYYPLDSLLAVQPFYWSSLPNQREGYAIVTLIFRDFDDLKLNLDDIENQSEWTVSQEGVEQAAQDINRWALENTVYPSQTITSADGAVSGDFHTIVPLEGTVDLTTCTPLSSDYPDLGGETIDKYTYGRWTDIEVASGTLVAYSY